MNIFSNCNLVLDDFSQNKELTYCVALDLSVLVSESRILNLLLVHSEIEEVGEKDDSRLDLLRCIIKVFMLRRTKAALVKSKALVLPTLSEVTM